MGRAVMTACMSAKLIGAEMRILTGAVGAMFLVLATPAFAGTEFATFDGDAIRQGEGGTRITKHGIDFWTTGTPPRKYQVLGVMTDGRSEDTFGRTAIGSRKVAKRVMALGGQGVIVMDQKTDVGGAVFVAGVVVADRHFTTRLLVVKYLD